VFRLNQEQVSSSLDLFFIEVQLNMILFLNEFFHYCAKALKELLILIQL